MEMLDELKEPASLDSISKFIDFVITQRETAWL